MITFSLVRTFDDRSGFLAQINAPDGGIYLADGFPARSIELLFSTEDLDRMCSFLQEVKKNINEKEKIDDR